MKTKLAGMGGAPAQTFVDDVFSTYLYTGNNSTQTITNGIDLAGKGGMVWTKVRSTIDDHELIDTVRGRAFSVESNTTDAQSASSVGTSLTQFNSNGYSLGTNGNANVNENAQTFVSWTFRKAAKFFDVVTYTGNGATRTISHNLGITPGMIIIKKYSGGFGTDWIVWHRSLTSGYNLVLNTTAAQATSSPVTIDNVTSSSFNVNANGDVNSSDYPYIVYLFAHDTSSTGIIQCGSYTTTGADQQISLGWEPQFVLVKNTNIDFNAYTGWGMFDVMRGMTVQTDNPLLANNSTAENGTYNENGLNYINPTATGFTVKSGTTLAGTGSTGNSYIYMAIRMPNKPPTSGTQVYNAVVTQNNTNFFVGFAPDLAFQKELPSNYNVNWGDRLRGNSQLLASNRNTAETTYANAMSFDTNTNYLKSLLPDNTNNSVFECFRRAPGFFDEVCYAGGNYGTITVNHNLTVIPELVIFKNRSVSADWLVGLLTLTSGGTRYAAFLNKTNPAFATGVLPSSPTAATLTIGTAIETNDYFNPYTYVAYLFATLAGISKVGSYTGNGTGQAIACGFSAGARFVLIKRTDDVGDWYTFDSARGLTSGSSPYLLLNSTAAEVTGNNGVYASTGGFTLGSTASTTTNINGASYIYLSVA